MSDTVKDATPTNGARRRRGRPALTDIQLTKEAICERALELAQSEALHELRITRLAQEFGVTPAAIHYLVSDKDGLISGVMNAFYRRMCASWPSEAGSWRTHLEAVARHVNGFHATYRGVVLYTATHNRHRVVQRVAEGETDYGLTYLDLLLQAAGRMKVDPAATIIFCESFVDFINGASRHATASRLPKVHEDYLRGALAPLDPAQYPGIALVGEELYRTDARTLFDTSLDMLLDAFELRRARIL